jgi:acyl carrier protein
MDERPVSQQLMTDAFVRRASLLFGASDPATIDPEADVIGPGDYVVGDHVLDSMDLVELLLAVEEDLSIPMVEIVEERAASTLSDMARAALDHASPVAARQFCERWSLTAR